MKTAVLSAANSIHTVKIVNSLQKLGHSVTLFSLSRHSDCDNAVSGGVNIKYLEKSGYISNAAVLKDELARGGYDVLYAHYATGYGALARKAGFHPTVLAVWGSDVYDFPNKSPIHRYILKKNLAFADKIFSTSRAMAKQTEKFVKGEIAVTPFGVDIEEFCPSGRKFGENGVHIGFLKSVSQNYGISYLLDGFAEFVNRNPHTDVFLDIYGDGDLLAEMKNKAAALGIDGKTEFFGRIPHSRAPEALGKMDIFCVPSCFESFGVAAVEAMACGLPCIAGDADGLNEVTVNNVTGITVRSKNGSDICAALERLVFDGGLCKKMGEAGRKRVVRLYDWDKNIRLIEENLKKVIKQ